jgi:hypothetical protein
MRTICERDASTRLLLPVHVSSEIYLFTLTSFSLVNDNLLPPAAPLPSRRVRA